MMMMMMWSSKSSLFSSDDDDFDDVNKNGKNKMYSYIVRTQKVVPMTNDE